MSETNIPNPAGGLGGPQPRPDGTGLPPKTGGGLKSPGAADSVDGGMEGEGGDRGEDTGGMAGEG